MQSTKSLWSRELPFRKRKPLEGDITADVAVIGGGMAGILTAYLLQQKGFQTVVLEAENTAGGITANTTAKITSQHGYFYASMINQFGKDKAVQYAKWNQKAIKKFEEIIEKNNIQCDFEKKDAYLYSIGKEERILREKAAASLLGIPSELVKETTLPFEVSRAVCFREQGQFHPLKFLKALSESLTIYENTRADKIDGNTVFCENGKVVADSIIVATHYPYINIPGFYFAKIYQERSYVVALKREKPWELDGMYMDVDKNGFSFRTYQNMLLLGGGSHRTGKSKEKDYYAMLTDRAAKWYPEAEVFCKWSAQDCITLDNIPYIGRYSKKWPHVYVATGFHKWGMTGSMAAAMLLTDSLETGMNRKTVFFPGRFNFKASTKNLSSNIKDTVLSLGIKKLQLPVKRVHNIPKGHGGIVFYKGKKAGVYKDKNGKCYFTSVRCTHLGCQLEWNQNELTWDCPCHGSRFDYKGNLLCGPAQKSLKRKKE